MEPGGEIRSSGRPTRVYPALVGGPVRQSDRRWGREEVGREEEEEVLGVVLRQQLMLLLLLLLASSRFFLTE